MPALPAALALSTALLTQPAPAAAPAPVAAKAPPTAAPAEPPPLTPQAELAQLKLIYDQSCNTRIYGAYDDVCSGLADQIRAYEAQARRDRRRSGRIKP